MSHGPIQLLLGPYNLEKSLVTIHHLPTIYLECKQAVKFIALISRFPLLLWNISIGSLFIMALAQMTQTEMKGGIKEEHPLLVSG